MKVVIVGASGKIGREVDRALSSGNEIVRVGADSQFKKFDELDEVSVSLN